MKEMVGGCCVCSDERGWSENPLVYCDGQNCTVAVHQACYGIVTVPTGPWYCRKCESQERSARVRCELCPSRDGALKKTDNQGWAHVVCALYIPEVRFGNVTTMEPIILQLIPSERYAKTCYICQEVGKPNRATVGACMQCNRSGCKMQFHVTCAQALGLLCEEAGNYLDNVKYCGYCQHHYSKLKKGGNVKTIPPYKPITHESSDSTSSPEKELEPLPSSSTNLKMTNQSGNISSVTSSKQRKSNNISKLNNSSSNLTGFGNPGNITGPSSNTALALSNSGNNKISSNNSSNSKDKEKHSKNLGKTSSSSNKTQQDRGDSSSSSSSSTRDKSKSKNKDASSLSNNDLMNATTTSGTAINSNNNTTSANSGINMSNPLSASAKESLGIKFTNSNFTETMIVSSESGFGSNNESVNTSLSSNKNLSNSNSINKKRKADSQKSNNSGNNTSGFDTVDINKDLIKDVSVTLVPLPIDKTESGENDGKTKKITSSSPSNTATNISSHIKAPILKDESRLQLNSPYASSSTNIVSSGGGSSNITTPSLFVSVPLSTANVPGVNIPSSNSTNEHITQLQSRLSPIVNSLQHHHNNNMAINLNSQSVIEKLSARINQGQQHHQQHHSSDNSNSVSSVIQPSISPTVSHSSNSSGTVGAVGMSTPESGGGLKITYEKQNLRVAQLQEQEQIPGRRSRTPDANNFSTTVAASSNTSANNNNSSLNNGGLKFTYESQIGATVHSISPSIDALQTTVKDSPPSSPGSEAGSTRKRSRKSSDLKDIKLFHNGVHATHMLGNQLNPASSVAQKMTDQLNMEIEDHSVYTQPGIDSGPQIVGVPFPGKQNNIRSSNQSINPIASMLSGNSSSTSNTINNNPQSLEQLLERQWEQGSQFLMEQAQHFDIASLLSCLHQLRTENVRLEDHVNNLIARRDHLLAVNARLAIPLTANISQNQASLNNIHVNGPSNESNSTSLPPRTSRTNTHFSSQQQQIPIENGIDFRHNSHQSGTQTTIRHSSSHSNYSSSTPSAHSQHSVLSSSSSSTSSSGINSGRLQHSVSGQSSTSTTSNSHPPTEQLIRSRGSSANSSSIGIGSVGGAGGGNSGNYHSGTQSSAYAHQSQLRREDQGKPS